MLMGGKVLARGSCGDDFSFIDVKRGRIAIKTIFISFLKVVTKGTVSRLHQLFNDLLKDLIKSCKDEDARIHIQ